MKKIAFRRIREDDNKAIAAIIRKNFEDYDLAIPGTAYFDPFLDQLSSFYDEDPEARAYFVAVDEDDRVLGGCGLGEVPTNDQWAELQKLYFADEIKGKGYGKEIIALIEKTAAEMGYKYVYIETHSKLETALHLYSRVGYDIIEKPEFVGHGAMDYFFLKKI